MYRMLPLVFASRLAVRVLATVLATVPAAKIRGAITKAIRADNVKALDAVLAKHGQIVLIIIVEIGFLRYKR